MPRGGDDSCADRAIPGHGVALKRPPRRFLGLVARSAQTLPVVDAGEPSGGVCLDVVVLTDGRVAVRCLAALVLQAQDATKEISVYINSPGGSVTAGLAIYDTMQFITCDVATYCVGQAASMGAVLLAAGRKGKRFSLPNARIMIHQPWGGAEGKASDISIAAKEILRLKDRLNEILAFHTGKSADALANDTERDFFMSAEEAKAYGLIDEVLTKRLPEK